MSEINEIREELIAYSYEIGERVNLLADAMNILALQVKMLTEKLLIKEEKETMQ